MPFTFNILCMCMDSIHVYTPLCEYTVELMNTCTCTMYRHPYVHVHRVVEYINDTLIHKVPVLLGKLYTCIFCINMSDMDMSVVGAHAAHTTATLAMGGEYSMARLSALSSQRLLQKAR